MPITFVTFIIGTIALMGIPIGAGFFSKDEIIANAGNNATRRS
jgi:NADH-quinone oxidoreductase subunit L